MRPRRFAHSGGYELLQTATFPSVGQVSPLAWLKERRANVWRSLRILFLHFVSRMAEECRGSSLKGNGQFSLSWDLARLPNFWGHCVGRQKSCFLSQESLQKRDSRAEFQVQRPESKLSCHGEGKVLFCASGSPICRDLREGVGTDG